jgi:hypothetical protein
MSIPKQPSPHAPKPDFVPPKDMDRLVHQLADELAKRLRPTPPARLLTFRIIRIRRKGNMNICDLVIGWVPGSHGVTVQQFAAVVTPAAAGAAPQTLTADLGPTVASQTITGVADGSSVQASIVDTNGVVPAPALAGSFTVNLTAPPAATGLTFTVTNVRPDDGSVPTLATGTPSAPVTPAAPVAPAVEPPTTT